MELQLHEHSDYAQTMNLKVDAPKMFSYICEHLV